MLYVYYYTIKNDINIQYNYYSDVTPKSNKNINNSSV